MKRFLLLVIFIFNIDAAQQDWKIDFFKFRNVDEQVYYKLYCELIKFCNQLRNILLKENISKFKISIDESVDYAFENNIDNDLKRKTIKIIKNNKEIIRLIRYIATNGTERSLLEIPYNRRCEIENYAKWIFDCNWLS